jgi:hypothetical protein
VARPFRRDPAIIGKSIRLDDFPTEVIGVAPADAISIAGGHR